MSQLSAVIWMDEKDTDGEEEDVQFHLSPSPNSHIRLSGKAWLIQTSCQQLNPAWECLSHYKSMLPEIKGTVFFNILLDSIRSIRIDVTVIGCVICDVLYAWTEMKMTNGSFFFCPFFDQITKAQISSLDPY